MWIIYTHYHIKYNISCIIMFNLWYYILYYKNNYFKKPKIKWQKFTLTLSFIIISLIYSIIFNITIIFQQTRNYITKIHIVSFSFIFIKLYVKHMIIKASTKFLYFNVWFLTYYCHIKYDIPFIIMFNMIFSLVL